MGPDLILKPALSSGVDWRPSRVTLPVILQCYFMQGRGKVSLAFRRVMHLMLSSHMACEQLNHISWTVPMPQGSRRERGGGQSSAGLPGPHTDFGMQLFGLG